MSWNVNGIRAAEKKGFLDFLSTAKPDILCIQETKASPEQLPASLLTPEGYQSFWSSAEKRGYSGVGVYTRITPNNTKEMGNAQFDNEGRYLHLSFDTFELVNTYFPNSQAEGKRLPYKLAYCKAVDERCKVMVAQKKDFVLCGDINIAHTPIDLAHPKANEKNPGYLPEERAWLDEFVGKEYIDTFRHFCKEPHHYTWWSYRSNAREKNIGWRLDYHFVHKSSLKRVQNATILNDVMGSDHCPIQIIYHVDK